MEEKDYPTYPLTFEEMYHGLAILFALDNMRSFRGKPKVDATLEQIKHWIDYCADFTLIDRWDDDQLRKYLNKMVEMELVVKLYEQEVWEISTFGVYAVAAYNNFTTSMFTRWVDFNLRDIAHKDANGYWKS